MNSQIEINGIHVHFQRECKTTKPNATLLFLHGWGGSSSSWDLNIAELSNHFDCIAVDLPGFGVSDKPQLTWGVADYASFIKSFAEKLELNKFVIVGKSFGGRVGIYYASKWPETLKNLILVSSAGIEKPGIVAIFKVGLAKLGKSLISKVLPKFESNARNIYYNLFGIKRTESDYKWEVKKLVTRTDLSEEAKNITVPTLIIWGSNDKVLPLKVGKKLNRLIKKSIFTIIKGGHNAHIESASEFNSIVLKYSTSSNL